MIPTLIMLGVCWLKVTPDVFAAQLDMFGDEDLCREHFSSLVLIEVTVSDASGPLSLYDFK